MESKTSNLQFQKEATLTCLCLKIALFCWLVKNKESFLAIFQINFFEFELLYRIEKFAAPSFQFLLLLGVFTFIFYY
jgi:hypothetical protein